MPGSFNQHLQRLSLRTSILKGREGGQEGNSVSEYGKISAILLFQIVGWLYQWSPNATLLRKMKKQEENRVHLLYWNWSV
jgi:hypothetical protein